MDETHAHREVRLQGQLGLSGVWVAKFQQSDGKACAPLAVFGLLIAVPQLRHGRFAVAAFEAE